MSDAPKLKRNSGRTGPHRLTAAEVAQRDQHAAADDRRRYGGQRLSVNPMPIPGPPNWFAEDMAAIWRHTLAAAPPGLLTAVDAPNLTVLCTALALHQRLARQLAEQAEPSAELIQQLRLVGAEAGRATRLLGLNPPERVRISLPVAKEEAAADKWGLLQTIDAEAA